MNFKQFKNFIYLNKKENYLGEFSLIKQAIDKYENLSFHELVWFLDESKLATIKRNLPWEFRRAHRLKDLNKREKSEYYLKYHKLLIETGTKQVRIIKKLLRKKGSNLLHCDKNPKVLDVGCGRGGLLAAASLDDIMGKWSWFGIDADPASLIINLKLQDLYRAKGLESEVFELKSSDDKLLPYESDSFDLITCFSVLEHVGNFETQKSFINEIARMLAKNGLAILSFPNKFNIVTPEEHVGVYFTGFVPDRFRNFFSKKFSGMPYDDIFPLSFIDVINLQRNFQKNQSIKTSFFSSLEINRDWNDNLMSKSFRVIGPGYFFLIQKQ